MQGDVPNDPNYTDDDMSEGDLGDGSGARALGHIGTRSRGKLLDFLSHPGSRSGDSPGFFSWTSCRAMYAAFREDLDAAREQAGSMEKRKSESSSEDTNEELHRRLQHVTEEVELLRTELEVTHRHLEGKHQALRILQGQAILDKATCHTKSLLQKSEERTKALEKEVNALQWEITFNQVQFKNVEISWNLKYERLVAENEALKETLEDRMREHREQMAENASLSQKCLELLSMLSTKERRDFQRTQPPRSLRADDSTLELAVFGACQCSGGEPCSCARSAAASRKQVLQLKLELEQTQKRKEEAYAMMDAYRIAFEQQLRRVGEDVLRLAETDRRPLQTQRHDRGKRGSLGVAERLKNLLPAAFKVPDESGEVLHVLLDLLNDKEEALAHQRKVSYMLARNTEDMEKRLQLQLEELGLSHKDAKASGKSEWSVDRDTRDCQSHLIESGGSATDDQQNTELIQPTTDHTNDSTSDEKVV